MVTVLFMYIYIYIQICMHGKFGDEKVRMMPQTSTHHLVQDSKARKELLHGVFRACDLNGDDWLSEGEFRNIAAWAQSMAGKDSNCAF